MAVLSIQSHVVYGYAGNTAAVFPMQRLGREVWAINTVEFSNHTGYGAWRGKVLGAELVSELVLGLEERGVLQSCEAVLSGYLGDASAGKAVIEAVKKVKNVSPNALYACDPVMGDAGRGLYVKPDIPYMFKNELVPSADIVFPNQFELEYLTGIKVKDINDLIKAVNMLHETGPSVVLVTSFREKKGEICMAASEKIKSPAFPKKIFNKNAFYKISTPELPLEGGVAGTGDMTASIFLSRYLNTYDLKSALIDCTASVFGILKESYNAYLCEVSDGSGKGLELNFIRHQEQLKNPSYNFDAVKII